MFEFSAMNRAGSTCRRAISGRLTLFARRAASRKWREPVLAFELSKAKFVRSSRAVAKPIGFS
jgi:hypothetical protein